MNKKIAQLSPEESGLGSSRLDFSSPSHESTNTMIEAPENVMTITKTEQQPQMQAAPHSSSIESFIKNNNQDATATQALTVSFTVMPKDSELKGIKLMEAVLKACGEVGADIANFSIKKDEKR